MREMIENALLDIEGAEQQTIQQLNITRTKSKTMRKSMRRVNRGLTISKGGNPDISGDFEVIPLKNPEYDWIGAWRDDLVLQATYERGDNGRRCQLKNFTIKDVTEGFDAEGNSTLKVSWLATDDFEEDPVVPA
jgi:hypothetical protein